ncbi:DUF6985 domain-containing protein [Paenibacillus sp. FSL R5-0810]|uniref:DUF6985 domain-containing protein n=1 Tax=Paenibacillus sp. FSL R5-0810 TaxID=2921659 RepID=UPI0030F4FB44
MTEGFRLEQVGSEDPEDECRMSGFGQLALFQCQVEYHFNTEDMRVKEAEAYIDTVLNALPAETIDEICERACEWKNEKMSSDTADYPTGLAEASGREILAFMSVGDVELYRNPYDRSDDTFGAILGGGTEWDAEKGMEIIIRGSKALEVREYLGYGEYAIWDEEEATD